MTIKTKPAGVIEPLSIKRWDINAGDGTDRYTSLASALDSGESIYFPPTENGYRWDGTLRVVTDGQVLTGFNPGFSSAGTEFGSAFLPLQGTANALEFISVDRAGIRDIAIGHNGNLQTGGYLIYIEDCDSMYIDRLEIRGAKDGIGFKGFTRSWVGPIQFRRGSRTATGGKALSFLQTLGGRHNSGVRFLGPYGVPGTANIRDSFETMLYVEACDGLRFYGLNSNNANTVVHVNATGTATGGDNLNNLQIYHGHFDSSPTRSVTVEGAATIFRRLWFLDCALRPNEDNFPNDDYAVYLNPSGPLEDVRFSRCVFARPEKGAIHADNPNITNLSIDNCSFENINAGEYTNQSDIFFGASSGSVTNNRFISSLSTYGIRFTSNAGADVTEYGNIFIPTTYEKRVYNQTSYPHIIKKMSSGDSWTPYELRPAAWWSALDLANGAVANWADRISGLSLAASSAPTRSSTSFNNDPGVTFDGTDDYFEGTDLALLPTAATAGWIVAVGKIGVTGADANTHAIVSYGGAAGRRSINRIQASSNGRMQITDGTTALLDSAQNINSDGDPNAGYFIVTGQFSPLGTWTGYLNGAAFDPANATGGTLATATDRIRIGSTSAVAAAQFANMVLADVIIGPGVLSLNDIYNLEGYFAYFYELLVQLPSSHLYKLRNP